MFVYQATDSKEHVALTTAFEPRTVGEDEAILIRLHSGLDTVQANLALGLPKNARDYDLAAEMLLDLGVHQAAVLTNNPANGEGLRSHGAQVVERLHVQIAPNPR